MTVYITATCCKCKKAYMRECEAGYFRETPDKYHCCPECKEKGYKERKPKSEEEKQAFLNRMKEARKRKTK